MKRKIRLTKSRLRSLDHALAFDDVLYAKFQRLNKELDDKYRKLYQAERVIQVLKKMTAFPRGNVLKTLRILEVHTTSEGTQVVVVDDL